MLQGRRALLVLQVLLVRLVPQAEVLQVQVALVPLALLARARAGRGRPGTPFVLSQDLVI